MPAATTFLQAKNSARSTAAGVIDGATDPVTFSVATGEGALFPATASGPFMVSIDNEILKCTSRTVDALTCARAQEGTSIAAHALGASVQLRVTAEQITDLQTAINALELQTGVLEGWVHDGAQNPSLGTLPANAFVYRVDLWVKEAFDSDGTDLLTVGYDGTVDAYLTSIAVDSAGVREAVNETHANAGATVGTVDSVSRAVEAYYTNGGTEPTVGKAYIAIHYFVATAEPA